MRTDRCKWPRQVLANAPQPFSIFSFQFSVFNLLAIGVLAWHAGGWGRASTPALPPIEIFEKRLCAWFPLSSPSELKVYRGDSTQPLFGTTTQQSGTLIFVPAAPFVAGATYRVELSLPNGSISTHWVTRDPQKKDPPYVDLSPSSVAIPANTLKLYLDFSEPMEQGVFLKHLTLQKRNGDEVVGAFRETELWSPDGKRLTVMLHPGRQKTGVNLNIDEGPVLIVGEHYRLVVSSQWRSTSGVSLGKEGVFTLDPIAADHEQPDPARWQVHAPKAGTLDPLLVITDELFEPQIFQRALQVPGIAGQAEAKVIDLKRIEWRFTPEKPWNPGEHQITIDPELEDMAGNTTQKPFEVDLSSAKPRARASSITFRVSLR